MAKCRHKNWYWLTSSDVVVTPDDPTAIRKVCVRCDETIPIGPSNDSPVSVMIEIEAAEIAAPHSRLMNAFSDQAFGWSAYEDGDYIPASAGMRWLAGWLAHAIVKHDAEQARYEFPTHPIGVHDPGEDALRDPTVTARNFEVISEQTRHDVAASVVRHADLPTDPATKFGEMAEQMTVPVDFRIPVRVPYAQPPDGPVINMFNLDPQEEP